MNLNSKKITLLKEKLFTMLESIGDINNKQKT